MMTGSPGDGAAIGLTKPRATTSDGPPPFACWQPATIVAGKRIPPISLAYLFRGLVRDGVGHGYVSRPGGVNWWPAVACLEEVTRGPNPLGVYEGQVVLDGTVAKTSVFFPDRLGSNDLIIRIQGAYARLPASPPKTDWTGVTIDGIVIQGTLDACGRIVSVQPVYPAPYRAV